MTATTTARPTKVRTSDPPPEAPASLSWRAGLLDRQVQRLVLAVGGLRGRRALLPVRGERERRKDEQQEVGGRVGDRERTGAEGHRLEGRPGWRGTGRPASRPPGRGL